MKLSNILVGLSALVAASAWASGEKGNGGNAIVCFDSPEIPKRILSLPEGSRGVTSSQLSHVTKIEAVDLYEALVGGKSLELSEKEEELFPEIPGETDLQYAQRFAERFKVYVPAVYEAITTAIDEFKGKVSTHVRGNGTGGVAQVYDVGELSYKLDRNRCVLITVANQRGMDRTLELSIDQDLFKHPKHSSLSRKVLLIHEMIYLWGRKNGHEDSRATIKLLGVLLRKNLSREAAIEAILANGFVNLQGIYSDNFLPRYSLYPEEKAGREFLLSGVDAVMARGMIECSTKEWGSYGRMTTSACGDIYEKIGKTEDEQLQHHALVRRLHELDLELPGLNPGSRRANDVKRMREDTAAKIKKIDEEVVAKRKAFSALLETAVVDIEKARLEFEWAVERDLEIEMAKGAGMSGCVLKNAEVVKKKLKETVRDWVDLWIRHDEAQKFFAEIPPCADVNLATE